MHLRHQALGVVSRKHHVGPYGRRAWREGDHRQIQGREGLHRLALTVSVLRRRKILRANRLNQPLRQLCMRDGILEQFDVLCVGRVASIAARKCLKNIAEVMSRLSDEDLARLATRHPTD